MFVDGEVVLHPVTRSGSRTIRRPKQLRHDVVCALASHLGDPFQPSRVLALDADEDAYRRIGVTVVMLHHRRVDQNAATTVTARRVERAPVRTTSVRDAAS